MLINQQGRRPLIFVTWEEPFQNQERFSVQNVISRRISSPGSGARQLVLFVMQPGQLGIRYRSLISAHSRPSKNKFEQILVPQEARSGLVCYTKPKILEYPWTHFFAFGASVPKNMKKEFHRTSFNQSEPFSRDESMRKKGFCTETGQPAVHETRKPCNRPSTKPAIHETGQPPCWGPIKAPGTFTLENCI